ncbi:hypothetical protein N658DRAFT_183392 [Parathielavia hyrcaniae]|uniref:Uncharacterized protein n=1 Tax=Parathielavia hyrcaniae TaxID=113614 RepID=A0AAN6QC99_9PEZI|nr:hypothetical protein N658DRAFT_183392 [Parathielavia hyrcaniae]
MLSLFRRWLSSVTAHILLPKPLYKSHSVFVRYLLRQTGTPADSSSTMDPISCGCIRLGDGQLYQPITCVSCGGSMRMDCYYCRGTGSQWYPCTHGPSMGAQVSLSANSQDGSSVGGSQGGGSSQGYGPTLYPGGVRRG